MSKVKIIFVLGVWVAILPYLGFPYSFKNLLFSVTGLGLVYIGYLFYKDSEKEKIEEKTFDNFSENKTIPQENPDLNKDEIK